MEEAYHYLMDDIRISYGDTVVVGVSGGPDSMVLLDLLIRLKKALDIEVVCAHVNHNVRKESANEKLFVENYCRNHGVIFEHMVIEDYGDDNFHNEARSKRYCYFGEIVKKYQAKYLLTAHHGDDLIETILMRIVRGSTLRGYSGFSKEVDMGTYKILRPFIHLTKAEILKYCKLHKIAYVQDASNDKDVYTRNRFRKYIVPEFKEEDPCVHKKFYKFSKTLLEYNAYIDKQVEKVMGKIYVQKVLNIELFLKEDHLIQQKIIYVILEQIYGDDLMLITDRHAELILRLIHSKKANASIHLPNNIKVIKSYHSVTFSFETESEQGYEIELIDYVSLPNGKIIEVVEEEERNSNYICRLNKEEIVFPLHVRTRKNGDKMAVKGMLGRKKINDIFIDSKISMQERESWPVVVDSQDTIVWLPGLKKSKFDKTKEEKYDIILKYY